MYTFIPFFIFSLFTTGASTVPPHAELIAKSMSCECRPEVDDRFEEPIRYAFGVFKGQCVDSCKFRRVIFLKDAQAKKYGADAKHVVIANVLHEGRHWIARVPVAKVDEVDVGFEKFLSNISHVVLRFKFTTKDAVQLYTQDEDPGLTRPRIQRKIEDLVLSAEAVPPKNHPFAFMESSMGKYLLAYRMLSIQETVQWMVIEKQHHVKQFKLTLDGPTREKLLRAAMNESNKKSFESAYQLLTNNCATSLMDFIDQEVGYTPTIYDTLGMVGFQRAIPIDSYFGTIYALGAMHLLGASSQIQNLEDEFAKRSSSRVGGSKLSVDRTRR